VKKRRHSEVMIKKNNEAMIIEIMMTEKEILGIKLHAVEIQK
jgi:hypothetical protein